MKKQILCVDDEPQNLELLKAILEPRGYAVLVASTGAEALSIVAGSKVDLVLLDVMMPDLNGYEVCERIRSDEGTHALPVIMLTALSSKRDRISGIVAGADDFLTKPFDSEEVLARVRMLIKMRTLDEDLRSSYGRMASMSDLGERLMSEFDPGHFDINLWIDDIAKNNLRCLTGDLNSPDAIITGIMALDGKWTWSLRNCDGRELTTGKIYLDPRASEFLGTVSHIKIVQSPADDPRLSSIAEVLRAQGLELSNLIIHSSKNFCLMLCNYQKEITRFDTTLIHYIMTQCLFMNSISSQIHETEAAFSYTALALARAAEANDEDTGNHIARVGEYAAALSRRLRMSDNFCEEMRIQGQLHDVGKVHISAEILKKPGKLTQAEFALMKRHPVLGAHIIGGHERLALGAAVALTHHEKWDGSGYPAGLRGEAIPAAGRIIAIADQYDALRSKRTYKEAFDHETARRVLTEGDGRSMPAHFDPLVLSAFKDIAGEFEEIYGTLADKAVFSIQRQDGKSPGGILTLSPAARGD